MVGALSIAIATLGPVTPRQLPGAFCLVCGDYGAADATLNVVLFAPLGFGLALAGARPAHIAWMVVASAGIEVAQLFLVGRHATIGDVVMNSAGGALGFLTGRKLDDVIRPSRRAAVRALSLWSAAWLLLQAGASYALSPSPTASSYSGQIARDLGSLMTGFPGTVLNFHVAGNAIPDWDVAADPIRAALRAEAGAPVRATVVARECPDRTAGIGRIADADSRQIVLLAQDGADLVFSVRTGANALRLRDRRYRLLNAFGMEGRCVVAADTISLEGIYSSKGVALRAVRRAAVAESRVMHSTLESWRLFAPFAPRRRNVNVLLTMLWSCLLTVPAGYAAWWITTPDSRTGLVGRGRAPRAWATVVSLSAVLVAGLFLIPLSFDVLLPSWTSVAMVLGGVVAGAAGARVVQGDAPAMSARAVR